MTKPARLSATLDGRIGETARNVGSTPSIAQGCRPCSATNQPSSAATHGSGRPKERAFKNSRLSSNAPTGSKIEAEGEQCDEKEAEPDHDAERPEQRRDGGYRVPGGLVDLRRRRLRGVLHVRFEQQRVAEILDMLLERLRATPDRSDHCATPSAP